MQTANMFLIGMPRSGTTSLAYWLRRHPDIFLAKPKEPNYYSVDLPLPGREQRRDGFATAFAGAQNEAYRLDGSVWYIYSKAAIPGLLADVPDAPLVVMLRNPVEVVTSLFNHHRFLSIEPEPNIEKALFGKRSQDPTDFRTGLDYMDVGSVGSHVKRLLNTADPKQVHFVDFYQLRNRPRAIHLELLEQLGLEEIPLDEYRPHNQSRKVRSKKVAAVTSRFGGRNAPRLQRGVANRFARANTVDLEYSVPFELRRRIAETLADEIDLLGELIKRDLSSWQTV